MSFKDEVKGMLQAELDADPFITGVITRFKQAIKDSITNPGIDSVVIMNIGIDDGISEQQITQLKMACVTHIGVPVDVSRYEMVVHMINFLQ